MVQFDGEIIKLFRADLLERKRRFPSWVGVETICSVADLNFGEKTAFLLRPVQDPARSNDIPSMPKWLHIPNKFVLTIWFPLQVSSKIMYSL